MFQAGSTPTSRTRPGRCSRSGSSGVMPGAESGKSFDTGCPMGPWITTADELDPTNLTVKCWVNGELRQDANTSDLIFDIPTLVATISAGLTLQPGDLIATGTPAGVGIGFNPPRFLKAGDEVSISIAGIGTLINRFA